MTTRAIPAGAIADTEVVAGDLRSLVGSEHVRPAIAEDSVGGIVPRLVVQPGNEQELSNVLKVATRAGLHVAPRGGGPKMGWGNSPRAAEVIISMRRMNGIIEHAHADMTATVQAGCGFEALQTKLSEHGQRVALDCLWPDKATVGGVLAVNDSGPLRVRFGSLRDLIIGITLALPDGTVAKSGGKVVKNVAGYDLPKLAVGSLGTLGIVTQAIFRLHPIPRESRTLSFSGDPAAISALLLAILSSKLVPTGVQMRASDDGGCEIDVRFEGTCVGCDSQVDQLMKMASAVRRIEPPAQVWRVRESLWKGDSSAAVCKFTLLPTQFRSFIDELHAQATKIQGRWEIVAQAVGIGLLRVENAQLARVAEVLQALRAFAEKIGGTLSILSAPGEMKSNMDAWGSAGDALGLMRSIKAQFDPNGILNPGRFIAGI